MLTHGSLFSGIEGFGLGAALAGIKMEQVIERSLEYELKKISLEDYEICSEPAERDPYPPYRERLHPRKHWQRKPYWLRTRSNPKKKGYH